MPTTASSEIAHLVPAAANPANSYWFVTDFLFGIDDHREWNETACLIHGSNEEGKQGKTNDTGIKHMVTNKVLLAGQKDYFDVVPCVIILPIMDRREAIAWTGGAYHAIMMIDGLDGSELDEEEGEPLEAVCLSTHFAFSENMGTAEYSELSKATSLLREYTRAILYAQKNKKPQQANFLFGNVATAFRPKLRDGLHSRTHKVRKISFQANTSLEGHPAPDPILLLTKAIAVLQKRHGFEIVASAEPEDIQSDLSFQAEEEFLRWREEAFSGPNPVGLDIVVN